MKIIIFRTNAGNNTGLGHLYRCVQLAKYLNQHEVHCVFMLDYLSKDITNFLTDFETLSLYNCPQVCLDESADALLIVAHIKQWDASWLIIDDYRLNAPCETILKQMLPTLPLAVIDDLQRVHVCNLLIDYKYRGKETQSSYRHLVPTHTTTLLGPAYVILPELTQRKKKCTTFTLMLSLGGSGNLLLLKTIIENLLHTFKTSIIIQVLIGPLASHKQALQSTFTENTQIEWLEGITNVAPYLTAIDFFFGCAGGILYQLLALNIPCMTFALSNSQQTPIVDLEAIGHYFHLAELSANDAKLLPEFIGLFIENKSRINKLCCQAEQHIDIKGCDRITRFLLEKKSFSTHEAVEYNKINILQLSENHQLITVTDQHINRYLDARNLAENSQNMIEQQSIPRLAHYIWWFSTQRESYLLSKHNEPSLYIWHEIKMDANIQYLIGGWFVCHEQVQFDDALIALNWQLAHCHDKYPLTSWLAVIHRENKFVKLLNTYMGFKEVSRNSKDGITIANLFPKASFKDFYFVSYHFQPKNSRHTM